MRYTIERLTSVLGATGVEDSEHYTRFVVHDGTGAVLEVSIEAREQRVIMVLKDASGHVRATADLAPVDRSVESRDVPGQIALHAGCYHVVVGTQPALAMMLGTR